MRSLVVEVGHRRRGIGRALLRRVADAVAADAVAGTQIACTRLELHVHTANDDALKFYLRVGFRAVEEIRDYYPPPVVPPHAWLLRLDLPGMCVLEEQQRQS